MKKILQASIILAAVLIKSTSSLADYGHGHYGGGYGHGHSSGGYYGGYGHGQYGGGDDNGAAILFGISASLLVLSSIDSAQRHQRMQVIQQAETEALNYDAKANPSALFMNAKSTIEDLQGKSMNNEMAAVMIVELNQEFRQEN